MSVRIIIGDVREKLRELPDGSVHCVVTSPPYFGLRDYGTGQWEGGDAACDHQKIADKVMAVATSTLGGGKKTTGHVQEGYRQVCGKCGARRIDRQIGLETTPETYVAEMVEVFREVRRVLRDDGTVWLNLGDSYASVSRSSGASVRSTLATRPTAPKTTALRNCGSWKTGLDDWLKPKDLIGIPWRVAFALQADGWYLRQDIIWAKPNPMPESVRDRCCKAHEYMFLLSKKARYYFDAAAIAEPAAPPGPTNPRAAYGGRMPSERRGEAGRQASRIGTGRSDAFTSEPVDPLIRNRRSVWTVATQPYSEAHFATFPPALIEPAILAGCPKDGTVLDIFGGAGTTGLVADRLQRNAILIELNPAYAEMARNRIAKEAGIFGEICAA